MKNVESIIKELTDVPEPLTTQERVKIIQLFHSSGHIFISGSGRSGLMIDGLANRLSQLGLSVSVVGEITSPHTKAGDLIIFNSASGKSEKMVSQAKKAKDNSVKSLLITTDIKSPLAVNCEDIVMIKAQSKYTKTDTIQPMGALFEQYSMILFDSLILNYVEKYNISEKSMISNHADIE